MSERNIVSNKKIVTGINREAAVDVAGIEKSVAASASEGPVEINDLKKRQITSFKDILSAAIAGKKTIHVSVDSKEPEEILKGTYIARALSGQGYMSNIEFHKDEIYWILDPPSE